MTNTTSAGARSGNSTCNPRRHFNPSAGAASSLTSYRDFGIAVDPNRRGEIRAHCPQCDPEAWRGKSLAVNTDRECWLCHRCGWRGGLRIAEVIRPVRFDPMTDQQRQRQQQRNRERMHAIWCQSRPVSDPLALAYLNHRGLAELGGDLPGDIRLHPALRYFDGRVYIGRFPALVAMIRDPAGEPVGLHRTYLMPDGRGKAPVGSPKKMMAPARPNGYRGAAIRMYPAGDSLVICEGMETALALRLALDRPVWSSISAHGLATVELPTRIKFILIAADHDQNRVGQQAAGSAARRLAREGRAVRLMIPDGPGDWLDVLNQRVSL